MRRILFLFLVMFFALYVVPSTLAQTPTNPLANIVPKCGYAGEPNSNACCNVRDLSTEVKTPVQAMFGWIPIVGGLTSDAIGKIVDISISVPAVDGMIGTFNKGCFSGESKLVPVDPKDPKSQSVCRCIIKPPDKKNLQVSQICKQYATGNEKDECVKCAEKTGGIMTALGCIKTDYVGFVQDFLLRIGIGLAGLISLATIIISAITIQTSGGDAEKISQAQDQIKASIFGLMLVIFSILILKIIGVNILGIPGFI